VSRRKARLLRQLARDVMDDFRCDCIDKNGNEPRRCPCRGDGTDYQGDVPNPVRGCWYCQARYALNYRGRRAGSGT
jgi:hypothetical protein